MSNEEHDILCTHLHLDVPDALDDGGQGWEEVADGALTYLLRSVLSKTGGGATNTPYTSSGMPEDSSRLKKHLSIVCDRLRKGGQLVAT
jgi:Bardet-Biedl syndrome 9 protein